MTPSAPRAQRDYVDLAGVEGGSVRFERLLHTGTAAAIPEGPTRYPGLAEWGGIGALKRSLRILAGSSPDLPVLFANRSAQLMKFAARLLCQTCRRVLTADLGWPGYHDILVAECQRTGRAMTTAAVRSAILHGRVGESELIETLRS